MTHTLRIDRTNLIDATGVIDPIPAPEWADNLPWTRKQGITTPEQIREFHASRGRTQLRSDDPTYLALQAGNTVMDWRDLYTFHKPNVKDSKSSATIDEWNGIDTGLLLALFI